MNQAEIRLPKLGESVAEATLTVWLKQVGDNIDKDEILCEVGTDKVESELPSEYSGRVVELLVEEGATVSVGDIIAIIETEDEVLNVAPDSVRDSSGKPTARNERGLGADSPTQRGTPNLNKESEVGFLSPVVRKMIEKEGVDVRQLKNLKGSGSNGRITKKDLLQFLHKPEKAVGGLSVPVYQLKIEDGDDVKQLSRIRKIVAGKLVESAMWIPHVTTFMEIDVEALMAYRTAIKEEFLQENNEKITFTHLMMYACVQTLKDFPQLNAWLSGDQLVLKKSVNLAFAIAIDDEKLIVPNVKSAQNLSLVELVTAVNELGRAAKSGKLSADQLQDSTFTVSNTGIFGSMMGTPIISAPQVAVLAFGQILRKPVVKVIEQEEKIVASNLMNVSISYDHRVVDGKLASQFLVALKEKIEDY